MEVHGGLLRQRGHGLLGILLKVRVPVIGSAVAPLIGDAAVGLIKKIRQKGRGFLGDTLKGALFKGEKALRGYARRGVQKIYGSVMRAASGRTFLGGIQALGNTSMDVIDKKLSLAQGLRHYGTHSLKQSGNTLVEQQLRQNVPVLNAPLIGPILNKTMMSLVKRKVNTAIENAVNKALGQTGKGLVTDLLKMGAKGVGPLMKSGVKAVLSRGVKNNCRKGLNSR